MKKRNTVLSGLVMVALLLGSLLATAVAAPLAQGENLLANSSFEQPFVNGAAEGWSNWFSQKEKEDDECLSGYHYQPKWNMETGGSFVTSGVTSQYVGNNWDTWSGGVYQTVPATPGVTYRFTFSGKGRASNESSPSPSDSGVNMNMRAGIDPNGSGAWNDSDVVWGASGSPHDTWQQFSVEATATGDQITVFTAANFGIPNVNQCRQFMDTWYDEAQLVAVGAPAPTAVPLPAATATPATVVESSPTVPVAEAAPEEPAEEIAEVPEEPQPEAEPEPVGETAQESEPEASEGADATTGTICVNAFHDENANGLHDANEGYMAGVTFSVANNVAIVGQAISDGSEIPTCFQALEPGAYQVAQEVPGRLEITTAANAVVSVAANMTTGLEFGSRLRQEEPAADPAAPATAVPEAEEPAAADDGIDFVAISGLAVILIGVLLLGALLFFLLRRQ